MESLPSRERGLKLPVPHPYEHLRLVAPFTGAWIEISYSIYAKRLTVGSLPSRERGLKLHDPFRTLKNIKVAPFTGAWIEIRIGISMGI